MRVRTLAALVVGRHFQAQYVWGIQGVIGAERDIPQATIDAIWDNISDGIPSEDVQIVNFTRQLLQNNRVDEALAQAVLKRLGKDQYVQLNDLHWILRDARNDRKRCGAGTQSIA